MNRFEIGNKSKMKSQKKIVGNNLVTAEEKEIAQKLKDENLSRKNSMSRKVNFRKTFYTLYGKRMIDVVISFPICVVLLPVQLTLGICTFFDVGLPLFYKQTRVGKDGRFFVMLKYRSMNNKTDEFGILLPSSQRVTRFGKFVRKYSIDELWNFWHILKGDMSIIGPRPMPVFIYERMCDRHKMRTAVRPGLECPRVIHVPGEEICKFQRTFENDIWYVENVSFLLDIKLIFLLIKMVFSVNKRGDQAEGKGISYFVGYDENGIAISMNVYKKKMSARSITQENSL